MFVGEYKDIPRIYTAIAEWCSCFLFCMILPRRISNLKFGIYSAIMFAVLSGWLVLTGGVSIILWIPCMIAAVAIMFLYLTVVLKGNNTTILYTTMKALLVAEFAAAFEWQMEYAYAVVEERSKLSWLILLICYGVTMGVIYLLETKMHNREIEFQITKKELNLAGLIVVLAFAASNMNFISQNSPFSSRLVVDIFITRTLIDLVGLAILYAYQMRIYELSAERELISINAMLKTQYEHYRNYQQNIDLINYKYHDLKHQIAGLKAEMSPEKREEWIDHLEKELDSYKPETQTGNQVLDGILDAKMPMIRTNQVKFTCVTDGELLTFLHVTDICTIFGNLLDNALESIVTVEDPEKRMVHLSVSQKKQFLCISMENYCDHPVKFDHGQPQTSKGNKASHGFGTKSVVYTAEKYGGSVSYNLKKDFFHTTILIPIPEA